MYYGLAFSIILLFSFPLLFPEETRYLLRQGSRWWQNRWRQEDRETAELERVFQHNQVWLSCLRELRHTLSHASTTDQQHDLLTRSLAAGQRQLMATDPDKFPHLYRITEEICQDLEQVLQRMST